MIEQWKSDVQDFIKACNKHKVKMLLVGGGAVNFHGYQRHSADVDFWLETSPTNLEALLYALKDLSYELNDFPSEVKLQEKNISLKFSPSDFDVELITNFSSELSFQEAYNRSEVLKIDDQKVLKINILSLKDLIDSKIKSGRPKDLLDVQELTNKE